MNNVLVVSNFNAGRRKALLQKKALTKFLLHNSKKFKFISIDEFESTDITDFDTIIAIGGDGTVNKVASKIIDTDKTLACLPTGTANLLAANIGMSFNINKNLKILKQGKTELIDIIKINESACVLRCGLGYDSDIICKTPQSLKNKFGYLAYIIAGIIFATRLNLKRYKITIDNNNRELYASCIIIANAANMYKNIFSIGNSSSVSDGIIDVFILKTQNPIIYFLEFLKILLGIRKNSLIAEYLKCKNISLENNWEVSHIDGEKHILKGNIAIKIESKKLKVYCK